jgi:cytidylate kinase
MAILTVSRELGAGGRDLAEAVASSLGYALVDKHAILNGIKAIGSRWEEWGNDLDEHRPALWEKYDWSFRAFGALLQSTILDYALKDKVVIVGRGGNFLLTGISFVLRIHLVAPASARAERIMERVSVDKESALWLLKKTDRERSGFVYALYGKPWDDPAGYDFIFNTGAQSLEEITTIVKESLAKKEDRITEESKKSLKIRAVAAKVKAGLVINPEFSFLPTLDVYSDAVGIIVRGIIRYPKQQKRIEEAARKLAEDLPLKCEVRFRL